MIAQSSDPFFRSLFKELGRLGYIEGQNLTVSRYTAEGHEDRLAAIAHEAVAQRPEMILGFSSRLVARVKEATSTIPIVANTSDPVTWGIVSNLGRPGGNITGVTADAGLEISSKRLALLKEAVPHLSKVGFLATPLVWDSPTGKAVLDAAKELGLQIVGPPLVSFTRRELERVFAEWSEKGVDGVMLTDQPEQYVSANAQIVANLATKARLPLISAFRVTLEHGGLMAYVIDLEEMATQIARQIDQILKGANPGDIPFNQASRFLLIINLKTAKAFDIAIPASLLARADELIE
jgi:putative ABC transport system substrate-binding protein